MAIKAVTEEMTTTDLFLFSDLVRSTLDSGFLCKFNHTDSEHMYRLCHITCVVLAAASIMSDVNKAPVMAFTYK